MWALPPWELVALVAILSRTTIPFLHLIAYSALVYLVWCQVEAKLTAEDKQLVGQATQVMLAGAANAVRECYDKFLSFCGQYAWTR